MLKNGRVACNAVAPRWPWFWKRPLRGFSAVNIAGPADKPDVGTYFQKIKTSPQVEN